GQREQRRQQPGAAVDVARHVAGEQPGGEQIGQGGDECERHAGSVPRRRGYTARPVFRRISKTPLMFESLTQRLSGTIERLRGRGRLTEENIRESLREVRIALLEADVALPVVQALVERIKVRAVGQEVLKSLTPGQ